MYSMMIIEQLFTAVTVAVETGRVVADVIVLEVDHPCHHDEDTMETG
jgi:hypothetical protein